MGACGIYKQPYGEKAQFYINGKLVNENTLDGSYVDALTDLLIGNHKNATEKTGFKGYMDEARLL